MYSRSLAPVLSARLAQVPAVALLGPRQVGKTTLALATAATRDDPEPLYLDLESERDVAKLSDAESYLESRLDRLVILDEVHRAPRLMPVLRSLIDRGRRAGRRAGLYLLLGSAGPELLRHSGETLAGRISYLELAPFSVLEARNAVPDDVVETRLWVRGGYPESLLAASEADSAQWRRDFIRTYLERDVAQFAPRLAAETLRRFWTMLAHRQGAPLNQSALARAIDVDSKTIGSYIDLLVDLLVVRRLPVWHANVGKRLVKSPKVYVRDSGLVHALLSIDDEETLLSHPVIGASWEGFVVENAVIAASASATPDVQAHYYRTSGGAEIDLLLSWPDGDLWAIEIKRGARLRPDRGFHEACADLLPTRRILVSSSLRERDGMVPIDGGIEAMGVTALTRQIATRTGRA